MAARGGELKLPLSGSSAGAPPSSSLILQATVWDCLDYRRARDDGSFNYLNEMVATCLSQQSEVVVLRIHDWPIVGFFELPTLAPREDGSGSVEIAWDDGRLRNFLRRFLVKSKNTSRSGKTFPTPRPEQLRLVWRKRIYGYRGDRRFPYLKVKFATKSNLSSFSEALTKAPVPFDGHLFVFKQVEANIPQFWRLLAKCGLRYTQWFIVEGYQVPREPISEGAEYACYWRQLKPLPPEESAGYRTHPMIMSFDIETHSSNERAFSEPKRILDEVTMISTVFRRDGEPLSGAEKIVYVNGDSYPPPDATLMRYSTEQAMLAGFFKGIVDHDPDVVTGYNILRFDFNYLNERLKRLNIEWPYLGRFPGLEREQSAQWKNSDWATRSGGAHVNRYMEMDGRVILDMILYAKQNIIPKLATWNLKEVARAKLGKTKREEKHVDAFRDREAFYLARDRLLEFAGKEMRWLRRAADADYVAEVPNGIPDGISDKDLEELAPKTEKAFVQAASQFPSGGSAAAGEGVCEIARRYHRAKLRITKEVEYNLVDSILVDELFDKMLVWPSSVQFSYVMGVSMTELQTKGQQIKCISQVFLEAHREKFLITARKKSTIKFEGGLVQEPKVGIGRNLLTFDFAGMYPSIMIAHNPSPDTLVVDDFPMPPELVTERRFAGGDLAADESEEDQNGTSRAYREAAEKEKKSRRGAKKKKQPERPENVEGAGSPEVVVRFVKSSVCVGLIPRVASRLVKERALVKELMARQKKGAFLYELYNAQQSAIKVVANSLFGFMGVEDGRLPCIEGAMFITSYGREMIMGVRRYIEINHRGVIRYGDTDSVMAEIPGIDDSNIKTRGTQIANEITATLFGDYPSIKLEYEKGFSVMIVFKKKKYAAVLSGSVPTPENIFVRGIVLARRDNCLWVQKFYRELLFHVLREGSVEGALRIIFDHTRRLFGEGANRATTADLVVIREYGGPYKGNYFLGTFANKLQAQGKQLASGDRLEYLFTMTAEEERGGKAKSGEKMELLEDYEQAAADGRPMKIDCAYYLEHVARTSIDQLFGIAYADESARLERLYIERGQRRVRSLLTPVAMILLELWSMGAQATEEEVIDRLHQLEDWICAEL